MSNINSCSYEKQEVALTATNVELALPLVNPVYGTPLDNNDSKRRTRKKYQFFLCLFYRA
jgi:hypothetical protein